jgi:hypothetical protein
MYRSARCIFCILIFPAICLSQNKPSIPDVDRTRIAEVYRVGEKLQDRIWPEWSTAPFGILFITDDSEFLIRHPKPNNEFSSLGYDKLLKSEVFVRPRKFQKSFLATFPAFSSTPVIVVGKAENTSDKSSTQSLFVVLHEHFHQLQYSRPNYFADVNALDLSGGDTSGMWQINYPFPYKNPEVGTKFRELTSKLLDAYQATENEWDQKLAAFLIARNDFAAMLSPADYRYASFQLWQEGIARYTQYQMAKLAAEKVRPSKAFRELKDFTSFDQEAARLLKATTKEMNELHLGEWERTVFYPFGAFEGLLLDHVEPDWRSRYFTDKFALEKFYPRSNIHDYRQRGNGLHFN